MDLDERVQALYETLLDDIDALVRDFGLEDHIRKVRVEVTVSEESDKHLGKRVFSYMGPPISDLEH